MNKGCIKKKGLESFRIFIVWGTDKYFINDFILFSAYLDPLESNKTEKHLSNIVLFDWYFDSLNSNSSLPGGNSYSILFSFYLLLVFWKFDININLNPFVE